MGINNSKDFYENYAASIISGFFPAFSNLQKGESPDFFNKQVGLEVVRAIAEGEGEIDGFWKMNCDKPYHELSQKQLRKMGFDDPPSPFDGNNALYQQWSKKSGWLYYLKNQSTSALYLCGYSPEAKSGLLPISDIETAVCRKLKLLNGNYTLHNENDVLVIVQDQLKYLGSNDFMIGQDISALIGKLKDHYICNSYAVTFDKIILLFLDVLFVINTNSWEYTQVSVTQAHISFALQDATLKINALQT